MFALPFQAELAQRDGVGTSPVVPTPPAYAALWNTALHAGLPLGHLYVVSETLHPQARGARQHDTNDVWVVHDPQDPQAGLLDLAHEIAHVQRDTPTPHTIDADWTEERETFRTAATLLQQWHISVELPGMQIDAWLARQLHDVERLRTYHHQAARLAGTAHPTLARRAYIAFMDLADDEGWTGYERDAVLDGYHDDDCSNARAIDINRALLRIDQLTPATPPSGFDALPACGAVGPALRLRAILADLADNRAPSPLVHHAHHHVDAVDVRDAPSLRDAIARCNAVLLHQFGTPAVITWYRYGSMSDAQRVYRLRVWYRDPVRSRADVWILCAPYTRFDADDEAVLVRYLRSWKHGSTLYHESLADGLRGMIHHLACRAAATRNEQGGKPCMVVRQGGETRDQHTGALGAHMMTMKQHVSEHQRWS